MQETVHTQSRKPIPRIISDRAQWRTLIEAVATEVLQGKPNAVVLDAGCGSRCRAHFPQGIHLVGIDDCEAAIVQNTQIHEAIIGDIQTHPLPEERFDLITCIDVLEHLPAPGQALENMWRALKLGGVMILRAPYLYSVKGLITKFTPHWVHVAFRRYLVREPNAGKPGYPPFKTYLKIAMTPSALIRWSEQSGGVITHYYLREGSNPYRLRERAPIAHGVFRLLTFIPTLLSFGRIQEYSDYLIAIRKEPSQSS